MAANRKELGVDLAHASRGSAVDDAITIEDDPASS